MTSTLSSSQRKVLYNTIGWGLPFLLSFLLGVVQASWTTFNARTCFKKQALQFAASGDSGLHPSIGKDHCFLGEGQPRVIFFHVPVLLLMACNRSLLAKCLNTYLMHNIRQRSTRPFLFSVFLCKLKFNPCPLVFCLPGW